MDGNGKIEGLLERIAASVERTEEKQERMATALGDLAATQARQGEELARTREELAGTREELSGIRRDMNRGFAQVNGRIDNVLAIAGRHHDDHEQRIQTLEQHVLGKKSS